LYESRWRLLRWAGFAAAIFVMAPYVLTLVYVFVNPPISALMIQKALAGNRIDYKWRSLDAISPAVVAQVVASEDGRFCKHRGVDWSALGKAVDAVAEGRPKGGGSTISMQTAKNLFLWNRPAVLRKPLEIPLAYWVDFVLGKKRTLEIYLNVAEWGPGLYGVEAAASHYFGRSAAALTAQEAAQLAAALPNPERRNAGRPGPRTFLLATRLRVRALHEPGVADCVLNALPKR
jgi:monofunctional biosynthetic peptidoglycan transglycosylase